MAGNRIVAVVAASGGSALAGADGTRSPGPDALVTTGHTTRVRPTEPTRPVRAQ